MPMMPSVPLTAFSHRHNATTITTNTPVAQQHLTPLLLSPHPITTTNSAYPTTTTIFLLQTQPTHTHNSHTCSQQRIPKLQAKCHSFNSINIDKKTNSNQHSKQRNYYFAIVITHSHCASLASFCDDWWIPYPIFEALLLNSD